MNADRGEATTGITTGAGGTAISGGGAKSIASGPPRESPWAETPLTLQQQPRPS